MSRRMEREREAEIVEAYVSGVSTIKIAKDFGHDPAIIYGVLKRNGIKPNRCEKISEQTKRSMLCLCRLGVSYENIGKALGHAGGVVSVQLRKMGVPMKSHARHRKMSENRRRELAERYRAGETFAELEKAYGVTCTVVRDCLKQFGVPSRAPGGHYKKYEWTDRQGRTFVFKSSWEIKYAQRLDANGYVWDYEPMKFRLRECKVYTPDFVVQTVDGEELHEVKGVLDDRAERRIKEFVQTYPRKKLRLLGAKDFADWGVVAPWLGRCKHAERVEELKRWVAEAGRFAQRALEQEMTHG